MTRVVARFRAACRPVLAVLAAGIAGCTPGLGAPQSLIDQTRILAVKADVPDTLPSSDVTFSALVASPEGTMTMAQLTWAFCITPKPLSENNSVALGCQQDGVKAFGMQGPSAFGVVPEDGCSLFGPLAPPSPPPKPGQPKDTAPLRARDADLTGGYYQPVRVTLIAGAPNGGDVVAFALQRLQCGLVGASIEVNAEFNDPDPMKPKGYHPNNNPRLTDVTGALDGGPMQQLVPEGMQTGPGMLASVPLGARVTLRAAWTAESSEKFPVLNSSTRQLDLHGETLRVSWFGSSGTFEHDVVGRAESELWQGLDAADTAPMPVAGVNYVENVWTAPDGPGVYRVWLVLRDSRGGIDYAAYVILVNG